jgi:5,10-methylenetetrahydromethanopterin reductase
VDYGISLSLARLPLRQAMVLATRAENAGFSTVSVGEAAHDSFAAATAMATATERVRIMTGVTTWTRPPITCATAAATVDEVSGGRFTLGLGTMPDHWSRDHYGIDPTKPLERMRAYVDVIRHVLGANPGESIDVDGRFPIHGYRRMSAAPRADLPVVLAATRPGMARLAGCIADGVYLNVIHTATGVRRDLLPAVARGLDERSEPARRFERILMLRCSIDDDVDLAWTRLRESLRMYLAVPYLVDVATAAGHDLTDAIGLATSGLLDEAVAAIPMALVREMGVAGTVDECRRQLARYDGLVDTIVFAPPSGLDAETGFEQIRRIIDAPWPSADETRSSADEAGSRADAA